MREEHLVGISYLREVTTLLQRVRTADSTAGVFEAADYQWWWRTPRPTDIVPQLFWFDDSDRPVAALVATDWGDAVGLDPIVMPDATVEWIGHAVERGLAHATDSGFENLEFVVDRRDELMIGVLAGHGFTTMEDEGVDSWLAADSRPAISPLHSSYRLVTRLETMPAPHHMIPRSGPDVESRLRQTSLYRPDLDLLVLDDDERPAAYGLFWLDPETATGLVEPMRTEDDHQRRGLARHVLTAGLNRLFEAGAARVKIAWKQDNPASSTLYPDVGFRAVRECSVVSRST